MSPRRLADNLRQAHPQTQDKTPLCQADRIGAAVLLASGRTLEHGAAALLVDANPIRA
jgi:hypothetical protein